MLGSNAVDDPYLTAAADDGGNIQTWVLVGGAWVIGRQAPADILVSSPLISRRHAVIQRVERTFTLVDCASRNGTFLNGQPVGLDPVVLINGAEITLGGAVVLHFYDPMETAQGQRVGRLQGVWLDEARAAAWVDGREVNPPLSAGQFSLLRLLHQAAGQIVDRNTIVAAVWPNDEPAGVSEEAIDGLIKRLRARLRETQPTSDYLRVIRGRGVRLVNND
jgi:pSer/pThr/pTyr-binding forkhead associated (FHA) protein